VSLLITKLDKYKQENYLKKLRSEDNLTEVSGKVQNMLLIRLAGGV